MSQDQQKHQKQDGGKQKEATIPTPLKYVFGGVASMLAAAAIHPMDLVKTRMQVLKAQGGGKSPSPLAVMKATIKNDGFFGLYAGLSASMLRQGVYATTRVGVFTSFSEYYLNTFQTAPPLGATVLIALFAGASGAFMGTPADVGLVRLMADAQLPPAERRNYSGVFNALTRIVKDEGVLALWRGAVPTVGRAVVVSVAQLGSYGQFRQLTESTLGLQGSRLHLVASAGSGFLTATASLPVDIAKTRIQNMKVIDGKPEYRGLLDVIFKVIRHEGVLVLWRGYVPYLLRVVPTTILLFNILEQINTAYYKYVLGQEYKSKI